MKHLQKAYVILIIGILYIPIATLILFSFNTANSTAVFEGFGLRWYRELFNSPETFEALRNTLILAISSALLSTIIGTAAAAGLHRMRSKIMRSGVLAVTNIPMMNPDIVTGMSMMLFFVAVAGILGISYNNMGFTAMLIAHTTFCLG